LSLFDIVKSKLGFNRPPQPKMSADEIKRYMDATQEKSVWDDVTPVHIANRNYEDVTSDHTSLRRAIHTISAYYNVLGVYRDDFNKEETDRLARHAIYAMCEKAMLDYVSTVEFEVRDKEGKGEIVNKAMKFLKRPNPQDTFHSCMQPVLRDLVRYDAGVLVKSFNRAGYLVEMRPYLGTEFWKEMDRSFIPVKNPDLVTSFPRFWSHGYTKRYWQRARVGLFIPYHPEEICYFMMYPRTDGIYGTDFLKFLKYQIQYLIDSTRAAGKTFVNGIVPSLVWEHPDIMNREMLLSKIKEIEQMNKGSYKFGGVVHTVANEKITTLSNTLVDMQWLEGQKFVASIIWGMWGFSSSEFIDSDESRAGSYVARNITQSRMLRPLLKLFERKVNTEILPYLRGYREDWHFQFIDSDDLTEQLHRAQVNATRASTASTFVNMGIAPDLALKLADVGAELTPEEMERLKQLHLPDEGLDRTLDYDGDPSGDSDYYLPMNLQQKRYNQAGTGTNDTRDISDAPDPRDRLSESTRVRKARVYIRDASQAPKGVSVQRGDRGGLYFIKETPVGGEEEEEHSHRERRGKPPDRGRTRGGGQREHPSSKSEKPSPKDGGRMIEIIGDNISVIIMESDGMLRGYVKATPQSREIADILISSSKEHSYNGYLNAAREIADEYNLEVKET